MGLLYGAGDMDRTLEVSTRCGADSDCNPATAAGILGTMLGYSNIPEKWMKPLREVEEIDFAHTDISLDRAYEMSFGQALRMIERGGGKVGADDVAIRVQTPQPVRFEQSFEGLRLVYKKTDTYRNFKKQFVHEFNGSGVVCTGRVRAKKGMNDYVDRLEGDRGDACRFRAAPFRHLLELRTSRRRPYDEDPLAQSGGTRQRRHGRDIGLCA